MYDGREHSFRFTPDSPIDVADRVGSKGVTSLEIGTLQIEVAVATGLLLFAWGLHPRARWQSRTIGAPSALPGVVRIHDRARLSQGVAVPVADVGRWVTVFDADTGWLRVAGAQHADDDEVLIATDTVVGIRDGQINSVWLRPEFE